MIRLTVKLTFIEGILGMTNADPDIHAKYIASRAPDAPKIEEEIANLGVGKVVENAMTVFPRDEENMPFFWDYQIKGYFKDTCSVLKKVTGSESSKIKAFKKEIDGLIFPQPRKIPILFLGEMKNCQRPLRAQTPQGERIALANSEMIPPGATVTFDIVLLSDAHKKAVLEWLDHGQYRGMGQWRNSGKGRFTYSLIKEVKEKK